MTKPNPRYEAAPIEMHWVGEPGFVAQMKRMQPKLYRFSDWKAADAGQAIPPYLVKQLDGSWKETFFPYHG